MTDSGQRDHWACRLKLDWDVPMGIESSFMSRLSPIPTAFIRVSWLRVSMRALMVHRIPHFDLTFYRLFLVFFTERNKPRGPDLQTGS